VRRGDIVTVAAGGGYAGKPRPAVVVQSDLFAEVATVTICPITSVEADAPLLRLELLPSEALPLDRISWIEVDKITTVRRNRVGAPVGCVSPPDLIRLNGALAVFLGLG